MKTLLSCIERYAEKALVQNIAVRVGRKNQILYETFFSKEGDINEKTLFDMASVTKILATTSLSLIALDRGLFSLDTPVSDFFTLPSDKTQMTVYNLLTHTMGQGHKNLRAPHITYQNVQNVILEMPSDIPIGSDVLYSCPGFILLGKILETVFGEKLNVLFEKLVCAPLSMSDTGFLPKERKNIINHNIESEKCGIVNDYNCQHLGGVAGNAGVFSNVKDMTKYAKMLLSRGTPIISEETFVRATQNYTADMSEDRGLGYLYVTERYPQTGTLFPRGSFGHCGHTGQSVFVDPSSGLYTIILSDATLCSIKKHGKTHYEEVKQMRADLHNAIKQDLG